MNTTKDDCQYCGIDEKNRPGVPDRERKIFEWHLRGHDEPKIENPLMNKFQSITQQSIDNIRIFIINNFGEKCHDHDVNCVICRAHDALETLEYLLNFNI